MSSVKFRRRLGHHPAVQPRSEPRRRRAGSPGGDQRGRQPAALRPAGAADLRQGQPRRRAGPDLGADLEDIAVDRGRGPRRHPPCAEDLATAGRRPRQSSPAASVRRSRIQANNLQLAAYGLNIDDLRTTLGNANVNTPKGNFDGPSRSYTINANDQIQKASRIRRPCRRLQQRRAGPLVRCGAGAGGRRKHQARRLGRHQPGDHRQHPAPARRQRHRRRRQHPKAAARAQGVIAGRGRRSGRHRPHDDDPRLGFAMSSSSSASRSCSSWS